MAKFIVIGNWKMNPGTESEAKKLFAGVLKSASRLKQTDVVMAPSFLHLGSLKTSSKKVALGAQDTFAGETGAFTGEVSTLQLKQMGVKYVILGHSERRAMGETSELINTKTLSVLSNKMTAIICIGEAVHDNHGNYLAFLEQEIRVAFKGITRPDLSRVIIAYEPIWAIGKTAKDAITPNMLHETVLYIQKILMTIYGKEVLRSVRIIYGGSVTPENAQELLKDGMVKGFLVGGASLSAKSFGEILAITEKTK